MNHIISISNVQTIFGHTLRTFLGQKYAYRFGHRADSDKFSSETGTTKLNPCPYTPVFITRTCRGEGVDTTPRAFRN